MNRARVVASLIWLSLVATSAGAQSQPVGWSYTMNMIVDSGGVAHTSSTAMRYSIVPGKVRMQFVQVSNNPMGADVEVFEDGFAITGPTPLQATRIDARHDHRIAMTFAIAGLIAQGTTVIDGAESIATSYPDFMNDLTRLTVV